MSASVKAIRGMGDLLPEHTWLWQHIEQVLMTTAQAYGFSEIRMPLVEQTALYTRAIGEVTDIVEKEMYSFTDRGGDSLSLRPEGTAGCVRAALEHGLLHHQTAKLFYSGPMFRYERPQKGRYRQFHQFGFEALGFPDPYTDAELMLLSARIWQQLGLSSLVRLEINSLGNSDCRQRYRMALVAYLQQHQGDLDADSQRRLLTNPLRILDSKDPGTRAVLQGAPQLDQYLEADSQWHLREIQACLTNAGVSYQMNPHLVRGLDYYNHTVFEWVTEALGAQGTVCAGGRYDGLVAQLGGETTPAVGMALGMERLVLLMQQHLNHQGPPAADLIILGQGDGYASQALRLAETVRTANSAWKVLTLLEGGSFKSQFRRADRSGARWALILGEEELRQQQVAIKWLREEKEQKVVSQAVVVSELMG